MFESILIGSGFAFAAAVQPGPLQAFLLSTVAQKGWKRTLPAACAPLLSDGPIALLVLLILNHITPAMYGVLQLAGGFLLLYFAWAGYRQWRRYSITKMDTHDLLPPTLFQATIVNILNPNPYLGWSLVLGPAIVARWHQQPINAVALIIAFYTTMVSVLAEHDIPFRNHTLSIIGGTAAPYSCVGRNTCGIRYISNFSIYFKRVGGIANVLSPMTS